MNLSDTNLRGRTVIASDGLVIGEIAELQLDTDAWDVESVQVRVRKEVAARLGAAHKVFRSATLELPTSKWRQQHKQFPFIRDKFRRQKML